METREAGKLALIERLRRKEGRTAFEEAHIQMWSGLEDMAAALEQEALAFLEEANEERSRLRREIVRRHQAIHGLADRVETSNRALYINMDGESLKIGWSQVWYSNRGGKNTRFKHLPRTKNGTDIRLVLEGAHEDEVEMLTRHEHQSRRLKAKWQRVVALRKAVRGSTRILLREAGELDGEE